MAKSFWQRPVLRTQCGILVSGWTTPAQRTHTSGEEQNFSVKHFLTIAKQFATARPGNHTRPPLVGSAAPPGMLERTKSCPLSSRAWGPRPALAKAYLWPIIQAHPPTKARRFWRQILAAPQTMHCQNMAFASSGVPWRRTTFRSRPRLQYIAEGTPLCPTDVRRSSTLALPKPSSDVTCWTVCYGRRRVIGVRAAQQPSLLGWVWRIRPFTDSDPYPPEHSILPQKRTDVLSRGVGMRGPSTYHAARRPRQLNALQHPFVPRPAPSSPR